ncbi:hypothetical protein [Spirosoma sp.]|uniref:hypothetical protein n=1 Tax=Spirosoma sp. TaxID=1899569 RepID=UPI0026300DFA|nr:hypothetical protein [Spirosoma sp.]MCX6216539.1 hypothetical protein [Spirosoma sp.]
MPINRKRYPPDWKQTSRRIRFGRAGGRCEWPECRAEHGKPHPKTGKIVCLQTAHLNRIPEQTIDGELMAMCPRCHFAYDRLDNLAKQQLKKRFSEGQLALPFWENSPTSVKDGLSGIQSKRVSNTQVQYYAETP